MKSFRKYLSEDAMQLHKQYNKLDLKVIGYRETNAKCCGTCAFWLQELCKNQENLSKIFAETEVEVRGKKVSSLFGKNLPPGAGIWVSPFGICPNYEETS